MRTSITHLPSGRWRARYEAEGRWINAPTTFDTKGAGKVWLAGVRVDTHVGTWVDPLRGETTVGEWAEVYWCLVEIRVKTRDVQMDMYRLWIEPEWGHRQLGSITQLDVVQWVAKLKVTGRAASTVRQIYWVFHKMMAWAVSPGGKIIKSPCPAKAPLPRAYPRKVVPLDAGQIAELTQAVDKRWSSAVWTLAYGGFRVGELAALRVDDVNFDHGTIRVDEKAVEVRGKLIFEPFPKTERGVRTVMMPWAVIELIAKHLLAYAPGYTNETLLFRGPQGSPLRPRNFANRVLTPAAAKVGIVGLTPHVFRHTAVSTWVQLGANMKQVADRAGCTIDTVQRVYAHLFPADEDRLRIAMDDAIRTPRLVAESSPVATERLAVASGDNIIQLRPRRR